MASNVEREVRTTFTVVDKASAAAAHLTRTMNAAGGAASAASAASARFAASQRVTMSVVERTYRQPIGAAKNLVAANHGVGASFMRLASMGGEAISAIGAGLSTLLSPLSMVGVALAGLGLGFAALKVSELGNSFEKTHIQIAGFLVGLGIVNEFDKSMVHAEAVIEKIRIAAAKLPGSADEYIQVFRAGLGALQGAVGGTLDKMTAFSNRYTAITKTLGVDAPQAGRDLNLMLQADQGRAGGNVRSFQAILPIIRKLEGQAGITARSFNEMTAPERADLLAKAMDRLQPMLDRAETSYDAMKGALISNIEYLTRLGTAPVFDAMKTSLGAINDSLLDSDGHLQSIGTRVVNVGRMISEALVSGVSSGINIIGVFGTKLQEVAAMPGVQKILGTVGSVASQAVSGIASMADKSGAGGVAAGGLAALGAATGPVALVAVVIGELVSNGQLFSDILSQMAAYGGAMLEPLAQIGNAVFTVATLIGDVLGNALGGFMSMIFAVAEPVGIFIGHVIEVSRVFLVMLRPALNQIWKAAGNLFRAIGEFLNPVIRILAVTAYKLYEVFLKMLLPVFNVASNIFTALINVISDFIAWLGSILKVVADKTEKSGGISMQSAFSGLQTSSSDGPSWLEKLMARIDAPAINVPATDAGSLTVPKARGGGGRAVMDFRYSRFDITQKFEEGMNPDQIAVAFANDLGKLGEQRLESGFSPIFGVR